MDLMCYLPWLPLNEQVCKNNNLKSNIKSYFKNLIDVLVIGERYSFTQFWFEFFTDRMCPKLPIACRPVRKTIYFSDRMPLKLAGGGFPAVVLAVIFLAVYLQKEAVDLRERKRKKCGNLKSSCLEYLNSRWSHFRRLIIIILTRSKQTQLKSN